MYKDNYNDNFSKTAESNKELMTFTDCGLTVTIPKLTLQFQKIHPDAVIPTYAHDSDAGMDIYAVEDVEIQPGETILIKTGLKAHIPVGFELQVRPRSGMSLKTKLRIANAPGTIDAGYRDEICVIAENTDLGHWEFKDEFMGYETIQKEVFVKGDSIKIKKRDRIAQFVFSLLTKIAIEEVEKISDNGNRGGGFGSTDKPNYKDYSVFSQIDNSNQVKEMIKGENKA